ncbi:MAG: RNA polymerase sigma-70 factor [Tannerella sp.]|jgi:RNA polymerase sigma-70 factor (ECF subfamily)|nr:RNA polymerase sigma-70 factor [Tannerella sp.]
METKELLHLISEDSRGSFDMFYNLYYEQVFRFSFYFLKDREACREVVQDVFFSVWQSRKKLIDIQNIETYLYVAVRNEANRFLAARNNLKYVSLEDLPVQLEKPDEDSSPEDDLITREMEELLTQAVNELPAKCRTIFLMAREEGMKPKQIAEILAINESTVRVQMKIAIEKIVTALKPYFPNLTLLALLARLF